MRRHPYHPAWKRALYSLALILSVLVIGTVGFHAIESRSYVDAFYQASMIATAQGSAEVPATAMGKIFSSLLAFLSMGAVVAASGFLFGPFLGQLWRIGHERWEDEKKK